jgi:hypothetical protein
MASKSQNDFGAFSFLIRGGSGVFTGCFAISTGKNCGFWMVNRGGFVVETWLLSASLSGSKIFLFFKLYFLAVPIWRSRLEFKCKSRSSRVAEG